MMPTPAIIWAEEVDFPEMSNAGKLTRREDEALAYLVRGFSNREIAAHLGISTSTVNKHIQQIFAKLSVRNRVEAVARALQPQSSLPELIG
jgi:DNA-binding NarL/FixJ family response regulator